MAKASQKVVKKAVKKVVRRAVRPWTKEDFRTLKAHSKARTPVVKVSKVMKRPWARCGARLAYWALAWAIFGNYSRPSKWPLNSSPLPSAHPFSSGEVLRPMQAVGGRGAVSLGWGRTPTASTPSA